MTGRAIRLMPPDPEAFAPFGRFVTPPERPGARAFYSDAFEARAADTAAVVHVNHVEAQHLPLSVTRIERHPHAAQCFLPLDVARYAVMVTPSDASGAPIPEQVMAIAMPGTMGVIYNPGVWHLGATVMERKGHFAVLMWRGGEQPDDELRDIDPITLIEAR